MPVHLDDEELSRKCFHFRCGLHEIRKSIHAPVLMTVGSQLKRDPLRATALYGERLSCPKVMVPSSALRNARRSSSSGCVRPRGRISRSRYGLFASPPPL